MPEPTLNEELIALAHLAEMKAAATRAADALKAEHKRHQSAVMTRMDAEGYDSVKVNGVTYSCVLGDGKEYATIQDRTKFVEWAKENDPELIEYKERGEQVNAFVRRLLDDGQEFPPGIGYYQRPYVSITGKSK